MALKAAITVPDALYAEADRLAARLGLSRSALYAQAVAEFIARQRQESVTERLDEVLARTEDRGLDARLSALQRASLPDEVW